MLSEFSNIDDPDPRASPSIRKQMMESELSTPRTNKMKNSIVKAAKHDKSGGRPQDDSSCWDGAATGCRV